jgi:hypothetical protein
MPATKYNTYAIDRDMVACLYKKNCGAEAQTRGAGLEQTKRKQIWHCTNTRKRQKEIVD